MNTLTYLPGMETEQRNAELSQWYTEPKLAAAVWQWANRYEQPVSVLEPAAGRGALIKPIAVHPYQCREVVAIDIDPVNCRTLRLVARGGDRPGQSWHVRHQDFLRAYCTPLDGPMFDLGLTNPPYEDGRAEAFVLHALTVCKRVVGIFKAAILFGDERYRTLWAQAVTTREVRLATRPSFGIGASGSKGGMTDFVVLEIVRRPPHEQAARERGVLVETWP